MWRISPDATRFEVRAIATATAAQVIRAWTPRFRPVSLSRDEIEKGENGL